MNPITLSQFVPIQPGATLYVRTTFPGVLIFLQDYFECLENGEVLIPIFTYYIDPVNGNDSNNGLSVNTAWLTTTVANTLPLMVNQTIGYKYNGNWYLYRQLNITMNQILLPLNLIGYAFNEFMYYIDPVNGNDLNNGLTPATAWLTTTPADAVTLTGTQAIGYYYAGSYMLYRSLGMTIDQAALIISIVTETADKF